MLVTTKYGDYTVTETATGLMAENTAHHGQLFLDHIMPDPNYTHDVARVIASIEAEYEFQNDSPQEQSPETAPTTATSKQPDRLAQGQQVLDNFDYNTVLKHMQDTDWKWCGTVPGLDRIKAVARECVMAVVYDKDPVSNYGTGGFMAYKLPWGIELIFKLSYTHSY